MIGFVIKSLNIHLIGEFILNRALVVIECGSGRPSWVFLMKQARELLRDLPSVGAALLANFIPDAPQNDAGMIAIAAGEIANIAFMPLIEKLGGAVRNFGDTPHVEGFVNDHETEPIRIFEQFRRWRIVTGADRVDSRGLQNLQLPFDGSAVHGHSQGSQIRMKTHALEFNGAPV